MLSIKTTTSHTTNNLRMDYWRTYETDTLGIYDSKKNIILSTGDYYFKTVHTITVTESNGLLLVEAGDSDDSDLLTRFTFAGIEKGLSTEGQIDKYYYID